MKGRWTKTYPHHDEQRYVEAAERRVYLIPEILAYRAQRITGIPIDVFVAEYQQRRKTYAGCTEPHEANAYNHASRCSLHPVLQWLRDGVIPYSNRKTPTRLICIGTIWQNENFLNETM